MFEVNNFTGVHKQICILLFSHLVWAAKFFHWKESWIYKISLLLLKASIEECLCLFKNRNLRKGFFQENSSWTLSKSQFAMHAFYFHSVRRTLIVGISSLKCMWSNSGQPNGSGNLSNARYFPLSVSISSSSLSSSYWWHHQLELLG